MSLATRLTGTRLTRWLVLACVAAAVIAAFAIQPPTDQGSTAASSPESAAPQPDRGRTDEALVKPGSFTNSAAPKSAESAVGGGMGASDAIAADATTEPSDVVVPGDPGGSVVGIEPRVIHTASVELAIPRKGFDKRYAQIRAVAGSMGGYVVDSSMTHISGDRSATITMRVPGNRFDTALDRLAGLGSVRSESVSSQDVSQEFVDTKSRLEHDKAVAASLQRLLAKATTVGEVLSVRDRLDQAQQQVEVEQGRLNYLTHMTELSTIEVSLTQKGKHHKPAHPKTKHGEWGVGSAISDASHRFVANINRGIVATGGALPALLALALAFLLGRSILRRRARRSTTPGTEI